MNRAWSLSLLLALAPLGCAHHAGTVAPGGAPIKAPAPIDDTRDATGSLAPEVPAVAAAAAAPDDPEGGAADDAAAEEVPKTEVCDPFAPWNRAMFAFNDAFYFMALKPVAKGYRAVVPRVARTGVENFFHNLAAPLRLVSDIVQFKGREAGIELGSFMINSTWGVLGFGNLFADNPEAKTPDTDLGVAMAHQGVGTGAYFVWPFIGPSTARDTVGWVGGLFLDPVVYLNSLGATIGVWTVDEINATSFRIGDYEALKGAALDPYVAVRDAYLQNRAKKAAQ